MLPPIRHISRHRHRSSMCRNCVRCLTLSPPGRNPASLSNSPSRTQAMKKQVRWGTVSVLEFRVGYNASAVPESGGPPVGLVGRPTRHSYSMIPAEDDFVSDSECESVDSESDSEMAAPLASRSSRHSRNDLWLDPMERARILMELHAFPMEDIALICQDVRATVDARAFSRLDQVTDKRVESMCVQDIRYGAFQQTREKVLLY